MPLLDLTEEARALALDLPESMALADHERAAVIATWRGRMKNEHVSARVFAALIGQMMAAGTPAKEQALVARMISEELEHGRLCAAVVHALGGEPIMETGELVGVPTHDDVAPVEGLLRNILSISCLSETVAVALIDAEREQAGPPELQEILTRILADEVQHARFGWRVLEAHAPTLTDAERERLSDYLIDAFHALRAHELHYLPPTAAPSALAESYGVCDGRDARALFFDTVSTVIIPRLEEFGFSARAAWQASLALDEPAAA
jgi:hypothetical protein